MKKISKKQLSHATIALFIFLITCCSAMLCFTLFRHRFFDGYSQMADLIIDQIVLQGTNKTGEWSFFWLLLFGGCLLILLLCLLFTNIFSLNTPKANISYLFGGFLCLLPACFQTIVYGKMQWSFWGFGLLFGFFVWILQKDALSHIAFFLCIYFDFILCNVLKGFVTHTVFHDMWIFILLSVLYVTTLAVSRMRQKQDLQISQKAMYIVQLPLPFLLLLYLKDSYQTTAEITRLKQPASFTIFILGLIAVQLGLQIRFIKNKKQGLCISSAISVFLFGSYMPAARFVPSDLHHHGEQLLPFTQLLKFHSMPYQDFSPVSGLYPLPIGMINVILGDTATTYSFAFTLFMIAFACLILVCIRAHVSSYYTFLLAFLFHMPAYCRTWIILPTLLILFLPSVRKNPGRFLYLYVGLGFLTGLYYPLFGFALLCGLFPYAATQFITYCKSQQYKKDFTKPSVYCKLTVLALPILFSLPMLVRMAKHVLAYSSQTLLGDGLTIKGRDIPDWFLPYITVSEIKEYLYDCLRLIGPMLPIWVVLICLLGYIKTHYQSDRSPVDNILKCLQIPYFTGLLCVLILLPLTYTYTLVIMDEDWVSRLFSRSGHVALWICIFLCILFLTEYDTGKHMRMLLCSLFISGALLSFPTMRYYAFPTLDGAVNLDCDSLGNYSINALPFPVSDDYQIVSSKDRAMFTKLGSGFMLSDYMTQLYDYKTALETARSYDPDLTVMGLSPYQLYYYLLDEKAPYTGKLSLAKNQKAATQAIKKIDAHTAFGSDLRPLQNYYIYDYLLTHDYAYDETTNLFVPAPVFAAMHPEKDAKSSLKNCPWTSPLYLGKCAASLGHNLDTLSMHLKETDQKPAPDTAMLSVQIDTAKLEGVTKDSCIMITWSESGSLLLDFDDGNWLIPLCINADYATGSYEKLYISIYDPASQTGTLPVPLKDVCSSMHYYAVQP